MGILWISIYHACSDWLTRRWLASTIHLRATGARDFQLFDLFSHMKRRFGPLIIQLVKYILKQLLFTSVSVKVMDIYLAASRLGTYPSLFTSTSVNNCYLAFWVRILAISLTSFLAACFINPQMKNSTNIFPIRTSRSFNNTDAWAFKLLKGSFILIYFTVNLRSMLF